mmetsp:Transcript_29953/g.97555  ORF Transcript_29953/g.97555 Transcript_29953/m.97555 type:complete len:299 (-) Transcript_29953:150-1046(-)
MMGGEAGDGFDVGGVVVEHFLVERDSLGHVVEGVVDARGAEDERRLADVRLGRLVIAIEREVGLIDADVHLAELEDGRHHVLVREGALELLLRVAQEPERVVRLAEPRLPPPVLVVALHRRERRELERLFGVAVVVDDVVAEDAREGGARGVLAEVELVDVDEGPASLAHHRRRPEPHEAPARGDGPRRPGPPALERALHRLPRPRPAPRPRPRETRQRPPRVGHRPHPLVRHARVGGVRQRPRQRRPRPRHLSQVVLVQQNLRNPLLLKLSVVDPLFHGERSALNIPHRLVVRVFLQ